MVKLKLIDVVFHVHTEFTQPLEVLDKQRLVMQYAELLKDKIDLLFVRHAGFNGVHWQNRIAYWFFNGLNKFWFWPLKGNQFIAVQQPDVVIVQGLGFPLQTVLLSLKCGSKTSILVQHHGELPMKGFKLWCQKLASGFINGYLFTSKGNAVAWQQKGIIKPRHKIFEVLEASTDFIPHNKLTSRLALGICATAKVFIWVGRLNANKNPLCMLNAFARYLQTAPGSKLYMIYQTDELWYEVHQLLAHNPALKAATTMVGAVAHYKLATWYSAADYYLSASFKEGSGYALLEAMACGCIPIVTNIPSFSKITAHGKAGYLYEAGNSDELLTLLLSLNNINNITSAAVRKHFKRNLSFSCIADDIYSACQEITKKAPRVKKSYASKAHLAASNFKPV